MTTPIRVVTTCHKQGLDFAQRWLDSRALWPKCEFVFYAEGYELPLQPDELQMAEQAGCGDTDHFITRKDVLDIKPFVEWKARHIGYIPPDYRFDVVKFAHKVFAAADAFYDFDGIGVWLDADCVTYRKIPEGLIEKQVKDAFIACYQRTGLYTETGIWIMDCAHPKKKEFLDFWRQIYFDETYKQMSQWHDCMTLDATIRKLLVTVNNLSGIWDKYPHPQAMTELGAYIDHAKGARKVHGRSHENKQRAEFERAAA